MNHKDTGTLGEIAVVKDLKKMGYPVFIEYGDNCSVDVIALVEQCPVRIQVKATTIVNGKVTLNLRKTGPSGYIYHYQERDFDVLALYVEEIDQICYISSHEALQQKRSISFRVTETTARNQFQLKLFSDYSSFRQALRDYTPPTLTFNDEGEEIVQTTTN